MNQKKRRASISIGIVLLLVSLFTLALIFYDFTRLSSSREEIDRNLISAMDSALVEYDQTLYQKYQIMALSDEVDANSLIKDRLSLSLNRNAGKEKPFDYRIEQLNTVQGAKLSEAQAIKRAILRTHQKKFVANKVMDWTDRLELLQDVPTYSKSMKLYSKSLKLLAKLKDGFDRLRSESEALAKKYEAIKELSIQECVNSIIETKQDIEALQEQIQDLRKGGPSSEQTGAEEEIKSIREEIKEKKEHLKAFREKLNQVKTLSTKLTEYSINLQLFGKKLSDQSNALKGEIERFTSKNPNKTEEVMNKVKGVLASLDEAGKTISSAADRIKRVAENCEKIVGKIDEFLNRNERMEEELSLQIGEIKDLDAPSLLELFGDKNKEASLNADAVLEFIWDSIAGDYLPDYSNLGEIALDKNQSLPSQRNSVAKKERKETEKRPLSQKKMAETSFDLFEEQSGEHVHSDFSHTGQRFIQKLIIADYAVETFQNINRKKGDSNIQAEVEYLLSGNKSEKMNVLITQGKIFSLRMLFNGISIMVYKQAEINELATSLSASTGFLGYPIVYGLISLGWSAIESAQDIKALNQGKSVPILKAKTEIKTDITNIVKNFEYNRFKEEVKQIAASKLQEASKQGGSKEEKARTGGLNRDESEASEKKLLSMNYEDYLVLFLFLEKEEETLLRISDLICLKENINTDEYSCAIHTEMTVRIPVIFSGAKNAIHPGSKGSYRYRVEKVRGY